MTRRQRLADLALAATMAAAAACSSDTTDTTATETPAPETPTSAPAESATGGSTTTAGDDAGQALADVVAAATRTADARSGTATAQLTPAADSGLDGARIATIFSDDDRDVSIVTLSELDSYSSSGPADVELRVVAGQTFYRSIHLDDAWNQGTIDEATALVDTAAGFDPLASPVSGLVELVSLAGQLAEIGPGRYRAAVTVGDLRALAPAPVAITLLTDPSLDLGDDEEITLSIDVADGVLSRLEARLSSYTDDPDSDGYADEYASPTVSASFSGLGTETVIEAP